MNSEESRVANVERSKMRPILTGILVGAFLGAAFAWVVSEGMEELEEGSGLTALKPADYFQLGISLLNLARQFSGMFRP